MVFDAVEAREIQEVEMDGPLPPSDTTKYRNTCVSTTERSATKLGNGFPIFRIARDPLRCTSALLHHTDHLAQTQQEWVRKFLRKIIALNEALEI